MADVVVLNVGTRSEGERAEETTGFVGRCINSSERHRRSNTITVDHYSIERLE